MHTNKALPTSFALSLAKKCGLVNTSDNDIQDHYHYVKQSQTLGQFQQMAITCSLQDAFIAYHGYQLTDEQVDALRIIYTSTKPWLLGHVVGVLMDKLDDPKLSNRDFAEALKTIIEQIKQGDPDPETKQAAKGMLIRLAKIGDADE